MGRVAAEGGEGLRIVAAAVALSVVLAWLVPTAAGRAAPHNDPSPLDWSVSGPRLLVLPIGPPGSLDSVRIYQPTVFQVANGSYLMYYTGYDGSQNRIMAAYSLNGIAWTRLSGYIFLNDGASSPFVLRVGSVYRIWFESVVWGPGPLGYTDRIYEATSVDGLNWSTANVVLDVGSGSAWDAGSVGDPWVVGPVNGLYWMYYSMYAANRSVAIGVATSTDFTTFTKWSGNPVLPPGPSGSWDDSAVGNPSVVAGPTWSLFYGGRHATTDQIGLATSSDGYHWIRSPVPFLAYDLPGTWDSSEVGAPAVVGDNPARLYYDGSSTGGVNQIGMVNLTGSPANLVTVVGVYPLFTVVVLIAFAGAGVALIVALVVLLNRESRRRLP